MIDPAELGDLCVETACQVGDHLLRWRWQRGSIEPDAVATKSSPTDLVTEADRMAEEMIHRRLMTATPGAAWLGEETGSVSGTPAGDGLEWVVDPIDGTTNFWYDLPGWSVSIAARIAGVAVAAAVHVPTVSTTFSAVAGQGAFAVDGRGRRPLAVSSTSDLTQALIATGFAYDARLRARQGAVAGAMVARVRDLRRAGAASVDLCSVAAGRVDGYFETGLQPWDLAAGALIAAEAGARVYRRARGTTVAAAPGIADSLDALLTELGS